MSKVRDRNSGKSPENPSAHGADTSGRPGPSGATMRAVWLSVSAADADKYLIRIVNSLGPDEVHELLRRPGDELDERRTARLLLTSEGETKVVGAIQSGDLGDSVLAGIGEPANLGADIHRSDSQARQVLSLLEQHQSLGPYLSYRAAVPSIMLARIDDANTLLVDTVLGRLLAQHNRDAMIGFLVACVEERSMKAAAKRLGIHRNSAYERSERIEGISGFSVGVPEDCLCLVLALKAFQLLSV